MGIGTLGSFGLSDGQGIGHATGAQPGIVFRPRQFLRVDFQQQGNESSVVNLTQRHVLAVAVAIQGNTQEFVGALADHHLDVESPIQDHEADSGVFEFAIPDQEIGSGEQGVESDVARVEQISIVGVANAIASHTNTPPRPFVAVQAFVVSTTQGHSATPTNVGSDLVNMAPFAGTFGHLAATATLSKRLVPAGISYSHTALSPAVQVVHVLTVVNASAGHTATASGISSANLRPVPATAGHTATPSDPTSVHNTTPLSPTAGHTTAPPGMAVDQVVGGPTFFGPGLAATSTPIIAVGDAGSGNNTTSLAFRFRAKRSAAISQITVNGFRTQPGFRLGTGGSYVARILQDDGTGDHLPVDSERGGAATHIGAASDVFTTAAQSQAPITWSSGAPVLSRNILYHLEIRNVDPAPNSNWASFFMLLSPSAEPTQPGYTNDELGVSYRETAGNWTARSFFTPIFRVAYADGRNQAQPYIAPLGQLVNINGPQQVRQTITPFADVGVASVGIRVGLQAGAYPLILKLRSGQAQAAPTVVSANVSAELFPTGINLDDHSWHEVAFASAVRMTAGASWALELSCSTGSTFQAYVLSENPAYGVSGGFPEGVAQFTNNSGAAWNAWPVGPTDADLQFYFTRGSAAPIIVSGASAGQPPDPPDPPDPPPGTPLPILTEAATNITTESLINIETG